MVVGVGKLRPKPLHTPHYHGVFRKKGDMLCPRPLTQPSFYTVKAGKNTAWDAPPTTGKKNRHSKHMV